MLVRINKHTKKLNWFSPKFYSYGMSEKIVNYFDKRYDVITSIITVDVKRDLFQVIIEFRTVEDEAAFRFLWLSNDGNIDLE